MTRNNLRVQLNCFDELIVDNFAGGGGASTGIELAAGRPVDIAINHNPEAIKLHKMNHPFTKHYCESVWEVDPREVCQGRKVALCWLSPDCFAEGTLILTAKGYIPIEEVQVGDLVLTHNLRWRKVTATMQSYKEEMIVTGYGNPGLVCSTGHPFYIRDGSHVWNNPIRQYRREFKNPEWIKAEELTKDDFWGIPMSYEPLPIDIPKKNNNKAAVLPLDERLLWLVGRYVGDGWIRLKETRAEIVIVCGKKEAKKLSEELNKWPRQVSRCTDGELSWYYRETKTEGQFTANSRSLAKWLLNNFGQGSATKTLPAWLLGADKSLREAFLEGYFGADGWSNDSLYEISTVSKKLAFGLSSLIASLGYSPMVYSASNRNVIEGRMVNTQVVYKVKWRKEPDAKHMQTFSQDDILWRPIRKTEKTGKKRTFYNISVDEDESYIAEGVIVHNCTHFSKAKGGKPRDKTIRGLAWVAVRWAATVKPRVIILENVEEFQTWGPLDKDGQPIKKEKGRTFRSFVHALEAQGYEVKWKELRACDYGAPTIRKRFFMIARCDGKPIEFPEPTHGPEGSGLLPYRTAADIIDWSIPTKSIFTRKKALAENTQRRIAKGLDKFVLKDANPFIVQVNHGGENFRGQTPNKPMPTVTAKHGFGVATPYLIQYHTETRNGEVRGQTFDEPIATVDAANRYGLTMPFISPYYAGGYKQAGQPADKPLPTVTVIDHNCLAAANLMILRNNTDGKSVKVPLNTITGGTGAGHMSQQLNFLTEYYCKGNPVSILDPLHTVTARDRNALISVRVEKYEDGANLCFWPEIRAMLNKYCEYTLKDDEVLIINIDGQDYFISDIGLRMLEPRELYNAQGFPPDYIISFSENGKEYSKKEQVARCGNAVPPPFAEALVRANLPELCGKKYTTMEDLHNDIAI